MYKFFLSLILFASLFFSQMDAVSAQGELLFGQNQFYSVVFRGNGEAIVYAKLVISNPDEQPLTDFSFVIPKVLPTELVVYQMKLPQECILFDDTSIEVINDKPVRGCLQYRDPDYATQYYSYGFSNGKAEYQEIQFSKLEGQYHVALPTPVAQYKSTAIIVAYAAKGYVRETMGRSTFAFETLQVPQRIQEIRVAVDVDSDLLLKGKQSSVDYDTLGLEQGVSLGKGYASSRALDSVVGKIGSRGPLVKQAKNLSANESFVVRGEYATSWFRLYLSSILKQVSLVLSIFLVTYFFAIFFKKRRGQQVFAQSQQNSKNLLPLVSLSVGLVSVILVVTLSFTLKMISNSRMIDSRLFSDPVAYVILGIAVILLYVLAIFGPAIAVAIKHGWKSLLFGLLSEFLWFVIFLVGYYSLF